MKEQLVATCFHVGLSHTFLLFVTDLCHLANVTVIGESYGTADKVAPGHNVFATNDAVGILDKTTRNVLL